MKAFLMTVTRAALFAAAVGFGLSSAASVNAATIDFGTKAQNATPYDEDGFRFDTARIVMGNCDSDNVAFVLQGSGPACMALNKNEGSILSRLGGGTLFSLTSFWFEIFGGQSGSTLRITSSLGGLIDYVLTNEVKVKGKVTVPGQYDSKIGQFITITDPLFANVEWIKFAGLVDGNIRVDDIGLTVPSAVPLPAGGLMLLAGLSGLAALRRRKTA